MKEYTVSINGVEHTMLLDDQDAERLGNAEGYDVSASKGGDASTKAKTPQNKSAS